MTEELVVLVTCANAEEAQRIAESMVLERLAACVNIVPGVQSVFFWEGKLCNEKEVLCVMKTQKAVYAKLEKRVMELHSYTTPEVIALPIAEGAVKYLRWVRESTAPGAP